MFKVQHYIEEKPIRYPSLRADLLWKRITWVMGHCSKRLARYTVRTLLLASLVFSTQACVKRHDGIGRSEAEIRVHEAKFGRYAVSSGISIRDPDPEYYYCLGKDTLATYRWKAVKSKYISCDEYCKKMLGPNGYSEGCNVYAQSACQCDLSPFDAEISSKESAEDDEDR